MEVDFSFLADSADAINGKIYVMGGAFDTIWTKETPTVHPKLSLVLRLIFNAAEIDRQHVVEILVMDEDGKNVAKVGGPLEVKKNPRTYKGWPQPFLTVMHFVNLEFPKFGDYNFRIVFNNNSVKPIPLRIAQVAEAKILPH